MKQGVVRQVLLVFVLGVFAGMPGGLRAASGVTVAPGDSHLRFSGRFDRSDPKGPRCAWPGSAVTVAFQGSGVAFMLRDSEAEDYVLAVVDGKTGSVFKVTREENTFRAAAGLAPGRHVVTLFKRTEPLVGTLQLCGIQLDEGAVLLDPPERPARRILFVGDSITCGYGNLAKAKEEHFSPATEDNYQAYGALTARALAADYTAIAWSGKCLAGANSIVPLFEFSLPGHEQCVWAFAETPPDVVVINLGTNDFRQKNPDRQGWIEAYCAFIRRIRKLAPNAQVYCLLGSMMNDYYPAGNKSLTTIRGYVQEVVERCHSGGDKAVHLAECAPQLPEHGYGADWHPNVKTHQVMADTLLAVIRKDLAW